MIEIVSCTDHNYVMPTTVMYCSVCENNKDEEIRFHLFVDKSVDIKDRDILTSLVNKYNQKEIVFYVIDKDSMKRIPKSNMFPVSTYYRLELVNLLGDNIDKVLFLDVDIIVRHSLNELWNTDVGEYAYAAVHDCTEGTIEYYNRLGYSQKYGYFNNGVLLINLAYFRKNNVIEALYKFIEEHPEKILYVDQDVFNHVLHSKILPIHFKYNCQNGFYLRIEDMRIDYYGYRETLDEAIKDPVIIHYTASNHKPWLKGCEHPMTDEFLYYRQKTVFSGMKLWKRKKAFKERVFDLAVLLGFYNHAPRFRDEL